MAERTALPGLASDERAHGVVEIGELLQDPTEDSAHDVGQAVRGLCVDFLPHAVHGPGDNGFDALHGVAEDREGIAVTQHRSPASGLLQCFEDDLPGDVARCPRLAIELLELGEIIEDRRSSSADDCGPAPPIGIGGHIESELDATPQGRVGGDGQAHALRFLRRDQLGAVSFDDFDRVVAPLQRCPPPPP